MKKDKKYDEITKPFHYNQASIEPLEVQEAYEDILSFRLLHVLRYVMRSPFKGNELKDLKKARFYLDREIEKLEKDEIYESLDKLCNALSELEDDIEIIETKRKPDQSLSDFVKETLEESELGEDKEMWNDFIKSLEDLEEYEDSGEEDKEKEAGLVLKPLLELMKISEIVDQEEKKFMEEHCIDCIFQNDCKMFEENENA